MSIMAQCKTKLREQSSGNTQSQNSFALPLMDHKCIAKCHCTVNTTLACEHRSLSGRRFSPPTTRNMPAFTG